MNVYKQLRDMRDKLEGNLNRMSVTDDLEELDDRYNFAKENLESLYKWNKERLEEKQKLREVLK